MDDSISQEHYFKKKIENPPVTTGDLIAGQPLENGGVFSINRSAARSVAF